MEPVRYIGGHVTISSQLLKQVQELDQAFKDIESGKREWNPDDVDWDALEAMYEDD